MKHVAHFVVLFASITSLSAHAQVLEPNRVANTPPAHSDGPLAPLVGLRAELSGTALSAVLYDEPGDGRWWALANAYKASFGAEGATYIPFFGSRAPTNYPVAFRIAAITVGGKPIGFDRDAAPTRAGDRVVFARGSVDEIYDLGLESLEQSLRFDALPAGELVIEVEVESDLACAQDGQGLAFAGEHGRVNYSRAVAIDARGRRADAPTRWRDGRIEIRVPAAELAQMRPPILVDPLVSTFTVGSLSPDRRKPDCAYDASTARWVVVYERVWSASDVDVLVAVAAADGSSVVDLVIDATVAWWAAPQIANNAAANQFLCVAETGSSPTGLRTIRARTVGAGGAIPSLGAAFDISAAGLDCHSPDVGGDPSPTTPTYYCVVWQRNVTASDHSIFARLATTAGATSGNTLAIADSTNTYDRAPSISPTNGAPPASLQEWTIVWQRWIASNDSDLWAARVRSNGVVSASAFALDTSSTNTFAPDVSSPTEDAPRRTLIAYSRGPLSAADTWGMLLAGSVIEDDESLTALSGSPTNVHHLPAGVDSDGHSFVVVDTETSDVAGGWQRVRLSTFVEIGGQIALAESQLSPGGFAVEDQVEVACAAASGGPQARALAVERCDTSVASFTSDVRGLLYDAGPFATFCDPGVNGVIACPCGNAPGGPGHGCGNSVNSAGARCYANILELSPATHTYIILAYEMLPSTLCIFAQGEGLIAGGTPFGDGVSCVGDPILRLATRTATADNAYASFPYVGSPTIPERSAELGAPIAPGDVRYYYVYYRDGGSIGCASTFNTTNAVRVQW